jgi:hypothetical protein
MVKKKEVERLAKKKVKLDAGKKKSNASRKFVIALSIVSIIGFLSIMLDSLFYVNVENYITAAWLLTLGLGLILETSMKKIRSIKKIGLTPEILGDLTMIIVGSIAIIAGILSIPQINVQNPSFLAVKGIISILAIIFIILQTWVAER